MTSIVAAALIAGFATSITLILAIGAQNAFVLRQGLMQRHVFWVCLICAVSDAILITAGVAGFGALSRAAPWLPPVMLWGGAAFLFVYGALRFRAALTPGALTAAPPQSAGLRATVLTLLAFTWLNPHVYVDTVGLIGAVSTAYEGAGKVAFGAGAVLASGVFFFSLGYGARLLAPAMARPGAWMWLDIIIGVVMWLIALKLILG